MKGFRSNQIEDKPYPNFRDVLEQIPELDIYSKYVPNLILNEAMSSPIGPKDSHPSFSVFWSIRKMKYLFKEHRYGFSGDCIDFVRIFFSLKNNREACMQICSDFGITDYYIDPNINPSGFSGVLTYVPKKRHGRIILDVTVRKWQDYDLKFWSQFAIDKEWLRRGNIHPIKYYYFNKSLRIAEKHSYVYVEKKDGVISYKIYQPFSKEKKWISANDNSVWELWHLLPPKGKLLIITKSRKDALSIMATTGIPATCLQAEGTKPKAKIIDELKSRFDTILLLYDNDYDKTTNWGRLNGQKLAELFNLPQMEIPKKYQEKDYSDLVKHYGQILARRVLMQLIKYELIKASLNENRERKET